jgi:hypothetical protein
MDDEELNGRFDRLEELIRGETDERRTADAGLNRGLDGLEAIVGAETAELHAADERLEGLIRTEATESREYTDLKCAQTLERISEEGVNTRRYMDVVAERLSQDIRLLAEGQGALRVEMISLGDRQERLDARQERLELRQERL